MPADCRQSREDYHATEVLTPACALNALEPEERRLVMLCCTLAAERAWEMLELYAPDRAPKLVEAARALSTLERRERLALFAFHLAPTPSREKTAEALVALRAEPAWMAALCCRTLPPPLRDRLLESPQVLERWQARPTPHPSLESLARRRASRALGE